MNADDYLADLLRQWLAADLKIPSYCAYEKRSTYGLSIVTIQSASVLCTKALDPIDVDHLDIAKPADANADPYLAFKGAYKQEMASLRPNAALIEQFVRVLNELHQTQLTKSEVFGPQLEDYLRDPTEASWHRVQFTARSLIDDIRRAINSSIAFDAQFYQQGRNIVAIANGSLPQLVDRSYNQPFTKSRQVWNGFQFVTQQFVEVHDMPTAQQALAWADDLRRTYRELDGEIDRLLGLIQQQRL